MRTFDIAVVGAGIAGSICAIALARKGSTVALIGPASTRADRRTTALMDQSVRFLDDLGLWPSIAPQASALSSMRIIDGTDRLLRTPTITFRAAEVGLSAFGYNIPNAVLLDAFAKAVAEEPGITLIPHAASGIAIGGDSVRIELETAETIMANFVVGADGRGSLVRARAGIATRTWSYPQTAVVMNFSHARPHEQTSTEFHTPYGPFTQVPLSGNRSSLVWVVTPEMASDMAATPLATLSAQVEARMQSMLGAVEVDDSVQTWPLSGMMAHRSGKGRVALIGEAAHVFPPIGAQGLNLSLRDVISLSSLIAPGKNATDLKTLGDAFDRRRRADIMSRTASVHVLNRSLLSDFLPVQMVRAAGLHLLSGITPLRHLVMREGIEPGRGLGAIPATLKKAFSRSA